MDEREEFEKWLADRYLSDAVWSEAREDYVEFSVSIAFKAWQAARAKPVVPEGYVLVPVEPTPAMLAAYLETHGAIKRYKAMLAAAPKQESNK